MKSKNFKYSLITEGKMEEIFFIWLKDSSIFKRKTLTKCRKHSTTNVGTLNNGLLQNESGDCCNKYFIFDVDNIKKEVLENHKILAKRRNITLIINNPCLEIVLLSFFKYIEQEEINKKWIEKKINQELKKLKWEDYKHDTKSLGKILENLSKSEECQKKFKENLLKYSKAKNNPCSNFIDLIVMLEGENNG